MSGVNSTSWHGTVFPKLAWQLEKKKKLGWILLKFQLSGLILEMQNRISKEKAWEF